MEINQYCTRSITNTNMVIDYNNYYVTKPTILITLSSGTTNVIINTLPEYLSGTGEIYSKVTLTFPVSDVGKEFNLLVVGE
jgi:hypothetical protein